MKPFIFLFGITCLFLIACEEKRVDPPLPMVSTLTPDRGMAGDTIRISGGNFGADLSGVTVKFGNSKTAKILSVSDTLLIVIAPTESTTGTISITLREQEVQTSEFTFYSVYMFGATKESTDYNATVWKDGVAIEYSDRYSNIKEGIVAGGDVHAIGYQYTEDNDHVEATYWKNGNAIPIPGVTGSTTFTGIDVSGGDVYICGVENIGAGKATVKYWKNGEAVPLGDYLYPNVTDIKVYGTDVYVTGTQYPDAVYWKNGIKTVLPLPYISIGYANAITKVGSDVYIVGSTTLNGYGDALLWKNDEVTSLTQPTDWTYYRANSVCVSGSDVYAGGWSGNEDEEYLVQYWKNGVITSIDTKKAYPALDIPCISAFKGDVFMTVASESFNSHSYLYRNDKVIFASSEFRQRVLHHQIVPY